MNLVKSEQQVILSVCMYLAPPRVILLQVLCKELFCHGAPNFSTLDISNVPMLYQVQPIGLIQFWPNQKIQICNPLIFSYKCCWNDHMKENFQEKEEIENAILVTPRRFKLSIITKRIFCPM